MPELQLAMPYAPEAQARARRADPETSKLAALHHEASGKAHRRRLAIREALLAAGKPLTPAEIDQATGIGYYEVQRRLSETARLGWIVEAGKARCPIRQTMTRRWKAAKEGR